MESTNRSTAITGWLYVGVQGVLIVALVVLPSRDDWPTPDWLASVAGVLFFGGFVIMAVAALGLRLALTATPVPNGRGKLTTTGLYRYARHPIYTGVLAVVVAMTLRSSSFISLAVAAVAVLFFNQKARWEEARLAEHFDDYRAYADVTPRFVPRPWK
ncbi:MAG: isoprenylcysteine carboxylmethyltransferase family protein [Actinobacteria bacterium]|nr:isoprenylcysteine carboxylmethyltransferase family protein [Actinomycetota bacterium]